MFENIYVKVIAVLGVVVILLVGGFYIQHQNNQLDKTRQQLSAAQANLSALQASYDTMLKQRENENEALKQAKNKIAGLDNSLEESVSRLDNLTNGVTVATRVKPSGVKNVKQNSVAAQSGPSNSNSLDNAIVSVLNDICVKVRGDSCPDP